MAGTRIGGERAARTNKAKHGEDFYKNIGKIGGAAGNTGGFYEKRPCECDTIEGAHTKPMCAGKRGGQISRRTKKVVTVVGAQKKSLFSRFVERITA